MTDSEFNKFLQARLEKIQQTLAKKGNEYGLDDRLHNFKAAAAADGTTAENAAWGMFLKHYVSVRDMVKGLNDVTTAMIDEKIGDAINYLILIEAILREKLHD